MFGNEKAWFEMPRCITWDIVDNPSPQSTLQVLPSFKIRNFDVTFKKIVSSKELRKPDLGCKVTAVAILWKLLKSLIQKRVWKGVFGMWSLETRLLSALVEFSMEEELKDSIVIAIPLINEKGHTLAKIDVEYEWNPPRCNTCKVFDHVNDKCPKNPKVDVPSKAVNDGFTMVTKRKPKPTQKNKQVEGVRLSKPALNLQYQSVDKPESSKNNDKVNNETINLTTNAPIQKKVNSNAIPTQNSFGALSLMDEEQECR
ncbi:hypothetical protein Tco_0931609 [Tanacetum coccineum]